MHISVSRIGFTLIVVAACAAGLVHLPAASAEGPARGAKLLRMFELAPTSLTNFGYTQSELNAAAPNGLVVDDQPAIGSGLISLGGNQYLGITDRGPNIDHFPDTTPPCDSGSANGKTHPLPQFTPAVVNFRAHGGAIELLNIVNLVTSAGAGITGLSNLAGGGENDDPSFLNPCTNTNTFNVNGMDVEDFALLPNGKFLGVEENRPSLFVGDLATGVIEKRYIPTGKALPGSSYLVSSTLPAVLAKRRGNRGFEAVAISPDQQTAYTMTQSPLEVGCSGGTSVCRNGRVLRILKLDVSNPHDIFVTGQYIYRMSDPAVYPAVTTAANLKLSAMAWVGPTKLLLLERSDEPGRGGVRLVLVNLEGATDINVTYDNSLVPEQTAGSGATHVSSQVVFEEFENQPVAQRIFWTYKLEGLVIRNANSVDIINDNDFGIATPIDAPTNLWTVKLANQLPLGK
jgi:hypothetical protein